MNNIGFPKIFEGNVTKVVTGINDEATQQSLYLLLNTESNTLFGDPDYGVKIKQYFYEQNNLTLRDILIDELYTKIVKYFPQIYLERKNIKIRQNKSVLYAQITYKNQKTFETNMFDLKLFETERD